MSSFYFPGTILKGLKLELNSSSQHCEVGTEIYRTFSTYMLHSCQGLRFDEELVLLSFDPG